VVVCIKPLNEHGDKLGMVLKIEIFDDKEGIVNTNFFLFLEESQNKVFVADREIDRFIVG
jgi:hypothetical protein